MTRLLRYLTHSERPVTQRHLAYVLGVSVREVQATINALRLGGVPIVSSGEGIALARTADELRPVVESLRRRYVTQAVTVRALRATLRRMENEEAASETYRPEEWRGETVPLMDAA